ncbi:cell wall metabolism sensor histidine kinase WalK [Paenibacillus sp. NEAU-GSW1]|uniref:sensor histidine kinase n=1 Tax=Paenibacillus sp. NEAU-GSW1 TaxID=2682486 RepID=UPI00156627F9|nr:HAMP domain-containing sensor histidine kinase [Paenibacillus sp. NEAU-GSW1]
MSSLKTRIVWSYLLLIVLVVCVLGGLFLTLIWNYYYGSAQSSVKQRALYALTQHSRSLSSLKVHDQADYMLQYMAESDVRLQLLDSNGKVAVDSDGFAEEISYATPDVKAAMDGANGSWQGEDPFFNERVTSVTIPIYNEARVVSMLRYSASVERIDAMVRKLTQMTAATGAAVILLFLGLSLWMTQRIVRPIQELTRAARYMADGDWTRRAVKRSNDEIGQLAETFNVMVVELNKREKLKNDFISSISHELRTPLTSIKGWSETLKGSESAGDEETALGLNIISRETDRLTGLVEDLLDFSKLSAGSIELHPELLDLNGPVKEMVHQLAVREEQTGVKMFATLWKSPILIRGDANRLKQVIINLVDNAFKFTPSGGTIRIATTVNPEGENRCAILTVADTGGGISLEDLPHVTEKFYKANTGHGGSGLGLAICKEIAELHGGTLAIDSERGAGTIVTMTLPIQTEIG